eukprot:6180821-Pyramimonas_sp.AAC.1
MGDTHPGCSAPFGIPAPPPARMPATRPPVKNRLRLLTYELLSKTNSGTDGADGRVEGEAARARPRHAHRAVRLQLRRVVDARKVALRQTHGTRVGQYEYVVHRIIRGDALGPQL